jgi:hypothetical protein
MRTTTNRFWGTLGCAYLALVSCKAAKAPDGADGGPGSGASASGASANSSGANGNGASSNTGASSNSGGNPSGGSGANVGTGGAGSLGLESVTGHVMGRFGRDVRFVVEGTLPEGQLASLALRFESSSGSPTDVFDSNFDGVLDSPEGRVAFDAPITEESFTATVTFPGLAELGGADVAHVSLYEVGGDSSNEIEVEIEAQSLVQLGEGCDPDFVESRCNTGLGCSGEPAQCVAPSAPTLDKVVYLKADGGPVLLARGNEPDDDLETLTLNFLNSSSQPVLVDLDGDEVPESSTLDIDVEDPMFGIPFFVRNKSAENFETTVPKIQVIAGDSNSNFSEAKTATIASPVSRSAGQSCDLLGFDQCAAQALCVTTADPYVGTCQGGTLARTTRCESAPSLDPAMGRTLAVGRTSGTSFWNAPAGCVSDVNGGHPEGIAVLTLADDVDTLTITTANPETQFDTVLYVLPACPDTLDELLGCNDDADGIASTLELTDVPAGTYLIVVDSSATGGGSFGVSVTAE